MKERRDDSWRVSSASVEFPDWGYARNLRSVLMTTSAEWSQSVYSCPFETYGKRLIAPNRDYPYEGLLAHQDGENWKFIDCVGLGLRDASGGYLPLSPEPGARAVTMDPWRVTYAYRATTPGTGGEVGVSVYVSYYLASPTAPDATTGCITVYLPEDPGRHGLTLVVEPFLDIRHMYAASNAADHRLHPDERGFLVVTSHTRTIVFYLPPGTLNLFGDPETMSWRYKLGSGNRCEVFRELRGRMETQFLAEQRQVASLFNLEVPVSARRVLLRLPFQCGLLGARAGLTSTAEVGAMLKRSRRRDRTLLRTVESTFRVPHELPFRSAILNRIVGLTKFGIYVSRPGGGHAKIPNAGAWWFKTPWYRDVFEGLLNSFETLMRLPQERVNAREIIDLALSCYDETCGLICARLPEFQGDRPPFNSSDATLLCLLAAHTYGSTIRDGEFSRRILHHTLETVRHFRHNGSVRGDGLPRDGPPRLDPATGLLLSVPHHSWIDTRSQVLEYAGWRLANLSNRASAKFAKELYDYLGSKEAVEGAFSTASFFLPEINAQWISVLSSLLGTFDLVTPGESCAEKEEVAALLAQARESFKHLFWNPEQGFLFNLVHESRAVRDAMECEAAVTAAALLAESVFTRDELRSIWRHAESTLLVHRTLQLYGSERLPFGLLAKNEDQRIYYGDDQYHADVIWPRSTPYLIRLLALLDESRTIRDLLVNNLDHQMSEAALFYNQELFSRPCGNNPAPNERTHRNPVPVKNPIQFWSQWCDAYVRFFSEGNGHA